MNALVIPSEAWIIIGALYCSLFCITHLTEQLYKTIETLRIKLAKAEAETITDSLTGLLNRKGLELAAGQVLAFLDRKHINEVTVAYIDLDYFKEINDDRGHHVGDEVLCLCTKVLLATFRNEDVVARPHGDEFVVLLSDTSVANARIAFERAGARYEDMLRDGGVGGDYSMSIGFASVTTTKDGVFKKALESAEANMRASKKARNVSR